MRDAEEQLTASSDHTHVGALLAKNWELDPQLTRAVERHHKPASNDAYARLICLADFIGGAVHPFPRDAVFPHVLQVQKLAGTPDPTVELKDDEREALYDELMAASEERVVLHGDLHHWNILSGQREPWLVIDPKGLVGDSGYEVGAFLANHPEASCEGGDRRELAIQRVRIMAEELDMSVERVVKWGIVLALIWGRWAASGGDDGWRSSVERAKALEGVL